MFFPGLTLPFERPDSDPASPFDAVPPLRQATVPLTPASSLTNLPAEGPPDLPLLFC